MNRNLKYLQDIFFLLMMGFSLCAVQACSGDEKDEAMDEPSKNTTDIAVTGSVEEYGCSYAKISGYANLNLLPAGSGNPQIGIEICMAEKEDDEPEYEIIATSMSGNCFTVEFHPLNPEMKYKYRSFVEYADLTHYGEYKTFTTKNTSTLISTGGTTDVTFNSATISSTLHNLKEDFYKVGVLCSTSKSALHPDSINSWSVDEKAIYYELKENDYTVTFDNLKPATTYYYASFVYILKDYYLAEIKSFTTKGLSNLTTTGDVSDITTFTATVTSNVVQDAIDDKLKIGIAYSTSEAALHPDSVFHVEEFSRENIAAGTCSVTLNGLSASTTYYYASFVEVDGEYSFSEIKSFTTKNIVLVQSGAVDLGLSVKWAACNVGASSPEEYGGYYAWGETEEKRDYSWYTYKWYNWDSITKYCTNSGYGTVDNKTVLAPEDDVAHVKLGGNWRMPTKEEIKELVNECTWDWTTLNGVNGQFVTGPNGNRIFLPAAGHRDGSDLNHRGSYGLYWSATLYEDGNNGACYLYFRDGYSYWDNNWYRYCGHTVRPVTE